MSEQRTPSNMAYKHTPTGKVYMVRGIAEQFKDKSFPDDNDLVFMISLDTGRACHYPLAKFFDKNPSTQEERFQLVTPV